MSSEKRIVEETLRKLMNMPLPESTTGEPIGLSELGLARKLTKTGRSDEFGHPKYRSLTGAEKTAITLFMAANAGQRGAMDAMRELLARTDGPVTQKIEQETKSCVVEIPAKQTAEDWVATHAPSTRKEDVPDA